MLLDKILEPGLTSELVHSLGDLVSGRVAESREEREELLGDRSAGVLSEDDVLDIGPGNLGKMGRRRSRGLA